MTEQERSIQSIYPLSPMQQGMLFHTLLSPKSGVYFNQILYTLTGDLQEAAMQRAWQQIVDRHEPLRTLFVWEGQEKLLQVVRRRVMLPWEELDWRGLSADEQSAKLAAFLQADRQRGFDLAQAPLMRLALIRLEESHYELIWSHHHLLMDGWSSFLILKDVRAIYQALSEGRDCRLEPLRPYRDYINWLQGQDRSKAEGFWRAALKGFAVPTPLLGSPADQGYEDQDNATADLHGNPSPSLMVALRSFARRHDLTSSTIVHAAWAMLLSRYSGEGDVVFGSVVSGRPAELAGVESMVGLFINTLPVRAQFSPDDSVVSWLKEFQSKLVELRQHEHSPLVEVQGWSEVHRDQPLFESLLVFENHPVDASVWGQDGNLQFSNMRVVAPTNYPLSVVVEPRKELAIRVNYDPRRFDAAAITRILGHFNTLLEGIVANPQKRLSELPLLTSAERHQILSDWNQTRQNFPGTLCVHQLIEEQVERTPDAIAAEFGDRKLTYRDLNSLANQHARLLRSMGIGANARVAICMERSLEMLVAVLAILKAGGAYVPLDPLNPVERLAFLVKDAEAQILLSTSSVAARLPTNLTKLICLDAVQETVSLQSCENLTTITNSDDLAYVIYTSGSTGQPKGVAMDHKPLVNLLQWQCTRPKVSPCCKTLQFAPLAFDVSFQEIFSTWHTGATLVLISEELRRDFVALLRFVNERCIERLFLPFVALNHLAETACRERLLPTRLREIITAGEQLRITPQIRSLFEQLDGCRLQNQYGPTESHVVTSYTLTGPSAEWEELPPIGRPIANAQLLILDSAMQPVPIGVPGELFIGGACVAKAYLNRNELTAERFIERPFHVDLGSRWYKTGDLARYLPNGALEYLGRLDHQVKIRGFRIELGEIESVLAGLPGVREAVVVAREEVPGDKRLVAYLTVKEEEPPKDSELRGLLQTKLPDYMVPSAFVTLDRLPLTPNGKVDRRTLPRPDFQSNPVGFVPPASATEEALANIWAEVLGIKQVGRHDNFFELGGHSLLAVRIVSRIRNSSQVALPLRYFFEAPTVASLAECIEALHWVHQSSERSDSNPMAKDRETLVEELL